jgi:hypothetical protein
VRYSDLMKQQEKLVRDMEASVLRRDTIVTRGEFTQKNPNVVTQGKLQREMAELQKKIKETNQVILFDIFFLTLRMVFVYRIERLNLAGNEQTRF